MSVRFFTSLDAPQNYIERLNGSWIRHCVPRKGETIVFKHSNEDKAFELEVVAVSYRQNGDADVELHIPKNWNWNISGAWDIWYDQHMR